MEDDPTQEGQEEQTSTTWVLRVLERIDARFPRFGRAIIDPIWAIAARYEDDELPTHAGALTYGAFLSLPPLLLLAASVVGFAISDPAKQEEVIDALLDLIPGLDAVAASLVESVVDGRVVLGLIAIPGLLWAASGFLARLRHALGVVFRTRRTGLISGRFRGMLVSIPLLTGLLIVLALPGSVSGLVGSGVVDVLVEVLTYLAVLVGGIAFFLALFRFLTPQSPLSWRDHLPGAVMATVGWLLLQWVGSLFVDRVVARSSVLYGALGAVFGLLAFLYAAAYVLLLSAELSQVQWERRKGDARGSRPGDDAAA
ncbi:MAG: YihY/virulence factor BrkB family protein [Actinomycetota bacterium]